jgi:hypothetical protein
MDVDPDIKVGKVVNFSSVTKTMYQVTHVWYGQNITNELVDWVNKFVNPKMSPAPIEMLSLLCVLTMQQVILKHLRFVDICLLKFLQKKLHTLSMYVERWLVLCDKISVCTYGWL